MQNEILFMQSIADEPYAVYSENIKKQLKNCEKSDGDGYARQ